MYDLQGQGIPLISPIDQTQVIQATINDTKLSKPLYEALGYNVNELKKEANSEISRGIATSLSFDEIARNINNRSDVALNKASWIARTEGHRVSQQAAYNAQKKAIEAGADVVKQWDATLDKRTRPSHARVDGQLKELEEPFDNGLMFPGDPRGSAGEVVNCRCVVLQRAKWALDDDELETLKNRAAYYGLDKTESFQEYQNKFINATESLINQNKNATINMQIDEFVPCLKDNKTGEIVSTTVSEIKDRSILKSYNEKNGWYINWSKVPNNCTIKALKVKGIDVIQGLVSYKALNDHMTVWGIGLSQIQIAIQN